MGWDRCDVGTKVTPCVLLASQTHSPVPFCPRHPPSQTPQTFTQLSNDETFKLSVRSSHLPFLSACTVPLMLPLPWWKPEKSETKVGRISSLKSLACILAKSLKKWKPRLLHITDLTSVGNAKKLKTTKIKGCYWSLSADIKGAKQSSQEICANYTSFIVNLQDLRKIGWKHNAIAQEKWQLFSKKQLVI